MNLEPVNLIALKFEREANDDIKSAFFHIPDVTCFYNLENTLENGKTILKTTVLSDYEFKFDVPLLKKNDVIKIKKIKISTEENT